MAREETRFSVLVLVAMGAFYAAPRVGPGILTTALMLPLPLVVLAHIRVADENHAVFGPVWLRRAQWGFIGGLLLVVVVMMRV